MIVYSRSTRWAAAQALALAGLIGVGAALVLATPASSAASAFELTAEIVEYYPGVDSPQGGRFRSGAPFCSTGRFDRIQAAWHFTCDDGTGSVRVLTQYDGSWLIADGSGRYAGLRGKGSLREESLPCERCDEQSGWPWRGTLSGVVDRDAVAPTIALTSATATKLARLKGAYTLRLRITLSDDVTGNPVAYTVRVCAYTVDACAGRLELVRRFGTATGGVSLTLRVRPPARERTVQLQLIGEDPVGNAISVSRSVRLPRR